MKIASEKNINGSHTNFDKNEFGVRPAGFDLEEIHKHSFRLNRKIL